MTTTISTWKTEALEALANDENRPVDREALAELQRRFAGKSDSHLRSLISMGDPALDHVRLAGVELQRRDEQHSRQRKCERHVAYALVQRALQLGYRISVNDGEELTVQRSTDYLQIIDALFTTDSDTLIFRDQDNKRLGVVVLVYGNGRDVISDHSSYPVIDALVEPIQAFAETLPA